MILIALASLAWGEPAVRTETRPVLGPELAQPIVFDASELALLRERGVLYRDESAYGSDSGVSAVVVRAPIEAVWRQILDFDAYVKFLPYVTASSLDATFADGESLVYESSMELTTKGIKTIYHFRNRYWPEENVVTFETFGATSANPVRAATGYWRLGAWEEDLGSTLVEYRIDVEKAWFVPGFVAKRSLDRAVPTVTTQMRKRAEGDGG